MWPNNAFLKQAVLVAGAAVMTSLLAGCLRTHNDVVLSQQKPLQVNVNVTGKFTVVIQEQAQQGMDYIAGDSTQIPAIAAPTTAPATTGTTPAAAPGTAPGATMGNTPATAPVSTPASIPTVIPAGGNSAATTGPSSLRWSARSPVIFADGGQSMSIHRLFKRLRADFPKVMRLLKKRIVGESHTGLLAVRGAITPAQSEFVDAENAIRTSLYRKLAEKNGISVAKEALAFYAARLRHLPKGVWVQLRKSNGGWVWAIWHGHH